MMNCEDYKLSQTEAPGGDGGEEHLANCQDCRAYRDEMLALNDRIAKALLVEVPELKMPELPVLEAENVTVLAPQRSMSKPAWFALAATVLVAAFVGVRWSGGDVHQGSIESQVLAHLDHEPYAYKVTTVAVSDERLAKVVPEDVATMNHDSGLITYAQSCYINGHEVPHLIIQGEEGPITILLMPEEMVDESMDIAGENIQGVILKVGDGSVAIIGDKNESLGKVKKSILESVGWDT